MGILRFLLAACVIAGHSTALWGLPMMDAGTAVHTFFTISGFYMALILTSKYQRGPDSYWLFISNRWLRIAPTYYVVLMGSLLLYAAASVKLHAPVDRLQYWVDAWRQGHQGVLSAIAVSQVTIVGLDVAPMFDFSTTHGFGWVTSMGPNVVPAWRFNFLPHAWSISVELIFYLFAPFLCRLRPPALIAIIAGAVASRMLLAAALPAAQYELIAYHFAPLQLGFLTLGILAFKVGQPLLASRSLPLAGRIAAVMPLGFLVLCAGLLSPSVVHAAAMIASFVAVPVLFQLSGGNRFDRFIGDLSYPMYLTHVPVRWVLFAILGISNRDAAGGSVPGWVLLLATLACSVPLVVWLDHPIDRWRQARVRARQSVQPARVRVPMEALPLEPA